LCIFENTKQNLSKERGNLLSFFYLPALNGSADQSWIAVSNHSIKESRKIKQARDPLVCDPGRWVERILPIINIATQNTTQKEQIQHLLKIN